MSFGRRNHPASATREKSIPEALEGSDHIVLTHVRHKRSVIGASMVLSTYWNYLGLSLNESQEIIVFGYSGDDDQLNDAIAAYAQSRNIVIVERSGANQTEAQRFAFWSQKFKTGNFYLWRLPNVLTFTQWDHIY